MYFLIYSAYPKKRSPEFEKYTNAHIACWINTKDREIARKQSRRMVERTNWLIDKLEEEHRITKKTAAESDGLQYYEQALIDDEVLVIVTSPKGKGEVPICRSEFLQDVTNALGKLSSKESPHSPDTLTLEVEEVEDDGVAKEKLNIEARPKADSITRIALWDDGNAWAYFRSISKEGTASDAIEMHATFAGTEPAKIAEILRRTLQDLPASKQLWERPAKRSKT